MSGAIGKGAGIIPALPIGWHGLTNCGKGFEMSDTYISEATAMRILRTQGDYSENQARIILLHSLKQSMDGATYYPMKYIYQRAKGRGQ